MMTVRGESKPLVLLKCRRCRKNGCRFGEDPAQWCEDCVMVGTCSLHEEIGYGLSVLCMDCYGEINFQG